MGLIQFPGGDQEKQTDPVEKLLTEETAKVMDDLNTRQVVKKFNFSAELMAARVKQEIETAVKTGMDITEITNGIIANLAKLNLPMDSKDQNWLIDRLVSTGIQKWQMINDIYSLDLNSPVLPEEEQKFWRGFMPLYNTYRDAHNEGDFDKSASIYRKMVSFCGSFLETGVDQKTIMQNLATFFSYMQEEDLTWCERFAKDILAGAANSKSEKPLKSVSVKK